MILPVFAFGQPVLNKKAEPITKDYPEISTIVLSAQIDIKNVVDSYKNGAKNYIIKDINSILELKNDIKNISCTFRTIVRKLGFKTYFLYQNLFNFIKICL